MKIPKSAMLVLTILLSAAMALTGCGQDQEESKEPAPTQPAQTEDGNEQITEDSGIPFTTEYIILSYPSELEDMVSIRYEPLEDGQMILFTTDFTGEELELFRFYISRSPTEGYPLGTLTDAQYGEMTVCVEVKEYSSGSWTPEEYAKLGAMQERVNDIIVQFHEDPRFVAARS
ncbi:MAG: hypothetical protein IIX23_03910 [Oscillospiraceae bacterium]|nr:hypothetical protein [Oscillospiraceae bacterium]